MENIPKKYAGGTLKDGGCAVASAGPDHILVAGFFLETITLGAGEANQTILVSAGVFKQVVSTSPSARMNCFKKLSIWQNELTTIK